jgi:hypothetical protein
MSGLVSTGGNAGGALLILSFITIDGSFTIEFCSTVFADVSVVAVGN